MITQVEVCCDRCAATFDVQPTQLLVALPVTSDTTSPCEVLSGCPQCAGENLRLVSRPLALLLVQRGAAALPLLPALLYPERRPRAAAPLSLDDLIDLHESLKSADAIADLAAQADEGS